MVSTRGKRIPLASDKAHEEEEPDPQLQTPEPDTADGTIGSRLRKKRQLEVDSPTAEKSSPERKRRNVHPDGATTDDTGSPKPRRGRPPKKLKDGDKSQTSGSGSASISLRQRPARKSAARTQELTDDEPVVTTPPRKRRKSQRQPERSRADSPSRSSDIHDEIVVAMSPNFRRRRTATSPLFHPQPAPPAEEGEEEPVPTRETSDMQADRPASMEDPSPKLPAEEHPRDVPAPEPVAELPSPKPPAGDKASESKAQSEMPRPSIQLPVDEVVAITTIPKQPWAQAPAPGPSEQPEHELPRQPQQDEPAAKSPAPVDQKSERGVELHHPAPEPTSAVESEPVKSSSAVTILKIIDYCAELEGSKKINRYLGNKLDTDGVATGGAPLALKVETLPILEELAEQLLHAFATIQFRELTSYIVERESVGGKAYARLNQLFEDTKRVYAHQDSFLIVSEMSEIGPNAIRVGRKANMATYASSCFGSGDLGFYHLDRYFLDLFAGEGQHVLKQQWSLYLDLKTQSFIAAMHNTSRHYEELLQEVFGGDLEQRLLERRPGAKALVQGELDFIRQLRFRRAEHRQVLLSNKVPRQEQCRLLREEYSWDDFLESLCTYISKNFSSIVGKQPAELKPLHESGLSLSPRLRDRLPSNAGSQPETVANVEATEASLQPPHPPYMTPGYPETASAATSSRGAGRRRATPRPIETGAERPKRATAGQRKRGEPYVPAAQSAPGPNGHAHPEEVTAQYSTAPMESAVNSIHEPTPASGSGAPPSHHLAPQSSLLGTYMPQQSQYVSPFAPQRPIPEERLLTTQPPPPPPATSRGFQGSRIQQGPPYSMPGPIIAAPPPPQQLHLHPYYAAFQRPHFQQSKPTHELYEQARRVANSKNSSSMRSRPQSASQRRPWTMEEETALMAGLDTVKGPHWSSILAMYGVRGSINEALRGRNQVQLKDKARNLKLFFLKNGIEVPYYLQFVTGDLKRSSLPGPAGQVPDHPLETMAPTGSSDRPSDSYRYAPAGTPIDAKPSPLEAPHNHQASPSLPPPPPPPQYPYRRPHSEVEHDSAYSRRESEPYYRPSPSLPPPAHPYYQAHSGPPPPPASQHSYALPPPPPHYNGILPPPSRSEPSTPTHSSFPNLTSSAPALPPLSTHLPHPSAGPPFSGRGSPYTSGQPYPPPGYSQGPTHDSYYGSPASRPPPSQLSPPSASPHQHQFPPPYRSPQHRSRPGSSHQHQPGPGPSAPGPMLPPLQGSPRLQGSPPQHPRGYPSPRQHQQSHPSPRLTLPPPAPHWYGPPLGPQGHGPPPPLGPPHGYGPAGPSQGHGPPGQNVHGPLPGSQPGGYPPMHYLSAPLYPGPPQYAPQHPGHHPGQNPPQPPHQRPLQPLQPALPHPARPHPHNTPSAAQGGWSGHGHGSGASSNAPRPLAPYSPSTSRPPPQTVPSVQSGNTPFAVSPTSQGQAKHDAAGTSKTQEYKFRHWGDAATSKKRGSASASVANQEGFLEESGSAGAGAATAIGGVASNEKEGDGALLTESGKADREGGSEAASVSGMEKQKEKQRESAQLSQHFQTTTATSQPTAASAPPAPATALPTTHKMATPQDTNAEINKGGTANDTPAAAPVAAASAATSTTALTAATHTASTSTTIPAEASNALPAQGATLANRPCTPPNQIVTTEDRVKADEREKEETAAQCLVNGRFTGWVAVNKRYPPPPWMQDEIESVVGGGADRFREEPEEEPEQEPEQEPEE